MFCVRFFVQGAHSIGPPTPARLGKVYKGALVVPLSSPQQRAFVCGGVHRHHTGWHLIGVPFQSSFEIRVWVRTALSVHCYRQLTANGGQLKARNIHRSADTLLPTILAHAYMIDLAKSALKVTLHCTEALHTLST